MNFVIYCKKSIFGGNLNGNLSIMARYKIAIKFICIVLCALSSCVDDGLGDDWYYEEPVDGPKYNDYIGAWQVTGDIYIDENTISTATYQVSVEQKVKGHSYYVRGWAGSPVSFDFPFEMIYNSNGTVTINVTQNIGEYEFSEGKANIRLAMSNSYQQLMPSDYKGTMRGILDGDKVEFVSSSQDFTLCYCIVRGDNAFYLLGDEYPLINPVLKKLPQTPVYYADKSVVELQEHSKGVGINLYIVGDGYTAQYDFGENGKFINDALECMEAFFEVEPMKSLRDYFNVKVIASHSRERGVSSGYSSLKRNTLFNVKLTDILSSSNVGISYEKAHDYVYGIINEKNRRGYNIILVMANQDEAAGTAYINNSNDYSNVAVVPITNKQDGFEAIVRHEAVGHAFAWLLDEYIYYNEPLPESERKNLQKNIEDGFGANLTLESRENCHWAKYFSIPGYENVGYFEGGLKYQYGVWRSEEYSCMDNNVPYFTAPSREKIYTRVMECSGQDFDFQEFLKFDKAVVQQSRALIQNVKAGRRLTNDVIILKNFSENIW